MDSVATLILQEIKLIRVKKDFCQEINSPDSLHHSNQINFMLELIFSFIKYIVYGSLVLIPSLNTTKTGKIFDDIS